MVKIKKSIEIILLILLCGISVFIFTKNIALVKPLWPIKSVSVNIEHGPSFEVYLPKGLDYNRKHPWVLGLSPGGNGKDLIPVWKNACDKFQWILVASNDSRNGVFFSEEWPLLAKTLEIMKAKYPVDPARLYATGLSGGGMVAHFISYNYPESIRGIIVNTCMIHEEFYDPKITDPDSYPKNKIAVFLASPTDFRYNEMQRDKKFLESRGWKTKWIEFEGGHTWAPPEKYVEAVTWLSEQE